MSLDIALELVANDDTTLDLWNHCDEYQFSGGDFLYRNVCRDGRGFACWDRGWAVRVEVGGSPILLLAAKLIKRRAVVAYAVRAVGLL